MKLSIGIVGLPNVGKSTLFQALTKKQVDIANYPFTTIDPNVGVVAMPDERLEQIARVMNSKEIHPAVFEFVDIAGLVKGAHQGAGLGNQFLAHIREVDAIIHLVRVFEDENVVHFDGSTRLTTSGSTRSTSSEQASLTTGGAPDPIRDIETILEELRMKDETSKERENLLSIKPQITILNGHINDLPEGLTDKIRTLNHPYLAVDLAEGLGEADLKNIFHDFLRLLDLITFFTANQNEARSWFVKRGTKAPQAAGVVHTDFEEKFIKAEVISWDKLIEAGGWNEAKQRGWMRLEGKEYIVEEGDVVEVKHN